MEENIRQISCWKRFANGVLFSFVLSCGFVLAGFVFTRGHFEEISQTIYPGAPLMNSRLLDLLLGNGLLGFVLLVLLGVLGKRMFLHSFRQYVQVNAVALVLLMPLVWFFINKLYLPSV